MSPGTSETSESLPHYYPPRAADAPWWRRTARRFAFRSQRSSEKIPELKNPDLAALLSALPGLGHVFVEGRLDKPALLFAVQAALLIWAHFAAQSHAFLSAILPLSVHQWIVTDCVTQARRRAGLPVLKGGALMAHSAVVGLALMALYSWAGLFPAGPALRILLPRALVR